MTSACDDSSYAYALNKMWVLTCGAMIFSMQVGFAFLEAGSIRKKNCNYVFWKLTLNSLFGVVAFWLFGYAFAFGDSDGGFIGGQKYYAGDKWTHCQKDILDVTQYANWTFQYAIAVVVVAITNGSISERTSLIATTIHCFLYVGFVYPVVIAWSWGGGWLAKQGYIDFTGSGIVHCTGAFAGLAGLMVVGPRYNKGGVYEDIFDNDRNEIELQNLRDGKGMPKEKLQEDQSAPSLQNFNRLRNKVLEDDFEYFGVTNLVYTLFGGLFLWLGFIFFNAGSSLGMYKSYYSFPELWKWAEIAGVNTFMGGCSAGLLALAIRGPLLHGFSAQRNLRDEAAGVCNAFLAGMVANGAGMNDYDPWASWVVGLIGCVFYLVLCKLFDKLQIDDAVEAFQLHGGGGTAGVLCCAFFNKTNGIYYGNSTAGKVFGTQLMGWACISFWSFLCSLIIWSVFKAIGILRTDLKTEVLGYDFVEFADDFDFSTKKLKLKRGEKNEQLKKEIY